jgi:hypothetical protein
MKCAVLQFHKFLYVKTLKSLGELVWHHVVMHNKGETNKFSTSTFGTAEYYTVLVVLN